MNTPDITRFKTNKGVVCYLPFDKNYNLMGFLFKPQVIINTTKKEEKAIKTVKTVQLYNVNILGFLSNKYCLELFFLMNKKKFKSTFIENSENNFSNLNCENLGEDSASGLFNITDKNTEYFSNKLTSSIIQKIKTLDDVILIEVNIYSASKKNINELEIIQHISELDSSRMLLFNGIVNLAESLWGFSRNYIPFRYFIDVENDSYKAIIQIMTLNRQWKKNNITIADLRKKINVINSLNILKRDNSDIYLNFLCKFADVFINNLVKQKIFSQCKNANCQKLFIQKPRTKTMKFCSRSCAKNLYNKLDYTKFRDKRLSKAKKDTKANRKLYKQNNISK